MEIKQLTYLLLLLGYLIIPIALSFRQKIRFDYKLRYILPATLFAGSIFVMWNMRFTELGIWSYNPSYLTGIEWFGVPIEEWFSLLVIPVSSAYIYEVLKIKVEQYNKPNVFVATNLVLFAVCGILAYTHRVEMVSFFTFFLLAIYLGYTVFRNRFKPYFFYLYLTFAITLVPFIIISAILNSLPAVIFNADHIMGIALLGIPVERFAALLLLQLITLSIYEYLSQRQYY